jgi:hypothetical protein
MTLPLQMTSMMMMKILELAEMGNHMVKLQPKWILQLWAPEMLL